MMETDSIKRQALSFALKLNSAADVRQLLHDASKIEAYLRGHIQHDVAPPSWPSIHEAIEQAQAR